MASLSPTPDDEPINRIFQKRFKISIFQPNHFGTAQKVPVSLSYIFHFKINTSSKENFSEIKNGQNIPSSEFLGTSYT